MPITIRRTSNDGQHAAARCGNRSTRERRKKPTAQADSRGARLSCIGVVSRLDEDGAFFRRMKKKIAAQKIGPSTQTEDSLMRNAMYKIRACPPRHSICPALAFKPRQFTAMM